MYTVALIVPNSIAWFYVAQLFKAQHEFASYGPPAELAIQNNGPPTKSQMSRQV